LKGSQIFSCKRQPTCTSGAGCCARPARAGVMSPRSACIHFRCGVLRKTDASSDLAGLPTERVVLTDGLIIPAELSSASQIANLETSRSNALHSPTGILRNQQIMQDQDSPCHSFYY
jgi:hypothetical protein